MPICSPYCGGEIAITAGMQDRGFGTGAVSAMTAYGRDPLGLNRTVSRNARAIRFCEKCGFREYDRTEEHVFMGFVRQLRSDCASAGPVIQWIQGGG